MSVENIFGLYGSNNIGNINDSSWKQLHFKEMHIHDSYDPYGMKAMGKFDADIAILATIEEIKFSTYTRKICLPPADVNVFNIDGYVVGYGLELDQLVHENILKYAKIPSVDQAECIFSDEVFPTLASKRTFCAGAPGKIPCRGKKLIFIFSNLSLFFLIKVTAVVDFLWSKIIAGQFMGMSQRENLKENFAILMNLWFLRMF